MTGWWRFISAGVLAAATMLALGANPGMAQSRAHVYLLRGLMNIFSLGMDTLGAELSKRGVYATVDNHADWQSLADRPPPATKPAPKDRSSLSVIRSAPTRSWRWQAISARGACRWRSSCRLTARNHFRPRRMSPRVLNLTQRDYAYMRRGPGFHGSLVNVDVSSDPNIDHLTIDKSPRLHARVISEVLSIVGGPAVRSSRAVLLRRASVHPCGRRRQDRPAGDAVKPEPAPGSTRATVQIEWRGESGAEAPRRSSRFPSEAARTELRCVGGRQRPLASRAGDNHLLTRKPGSTASEPGFGVLPGRDFSESFSRFREPYCRAGAGVSIDRQLARPCMTQSWSFSISVMVSAIHTPAATRNETIAIAMTFISIRWR